MQISNDEWLSEIFGYPAFTVVQFDKDSLDDVVNHFNKQKRAFYFSKIPVLETDKVQALTLAGFYPVNMLITFKHQTNQLLSSAEVNDSSFHVEEYIPEFRDAVLGIAESCFVYSRFHNDHSLDKCIGNRVYRSWLTSYIEKTRGERLFIGVLNGGPVGFLAVAGNESQGSVYKIIDLVGVDKKYQNCGIGTKLLKFFISQYSSMADVLQVGTEAANIRSLRMYEKNGFRIAETQYVLHAHKK